MCEWCAVRISTALETRIQRRSFVFWMQKAANSLERKHTRSEWQQREGLHFLESNTTKFLMWLFPFYWCNAPHCFEISIKRSTRLNFCVVSIMAEIGTKLISDCTKAAIIECWGASPLAGWSRPGAVFPLDRPQPAVTRSLSRLVQSLLLEAAIAISQQPLNNRSAVAHRTFNYSRPPRLWLKIHHLQLRC